MLCAQRGGWEDYRGGIELSLSVSFPDKPGRDGIPGKRTECAYAKEALEKLTHHYLRQKGR